MKKTGTILAAVAAGLLVSTSAFAGDVRIMWYSDGVEGEVMQDLLNRFMKDNPDIHVTLDNGASVEGDIFIESPGFNLFNMKKKKRTPRITIGANSRVGGVINTEREIELYVHESAEIGGVAGLEHRLTQLDGHLGAVVAQ